MYNIFFACQIAR